MNALRRILLACLIIGLTACASAPPDTPKSSKVLVLSSLGKSMFLHQVGITVFGNAQQKVDVSAWDIDASVEEFAKTTLSNAGRQIATIQGNAIQEIGDISYIGFTQTYSFVDGPSGLKKVAARANADFVVLITEFPKGGGDPFFRTNQPITGYGVYQRRGGGSINYAVIRALLINGRSGEIIAFRSAAESSPRSEDLLLDIEKSTITIGTLGNGQPDFQRVIDRAVGSVLLQMNLLTR